MKAQNSIDFSDCYMPEFGYFGKNDPGFNLDSKLTKEWEIDTFESDVEKTKKVLDTETLAKEFEALKKENEILNELSKNKSYINKIIFFPCVPRAPRGYIF